MGLALPKPQAPMLVKPKGDEKQRIVRMRTALVMASPYYGLLAMKLKLVEDAACGTAATDGKALFYNPSFVAGMSDAKLKGLVGHETLHCTYGHIWRRGTREHRLWNYACDYAINQILVRHGFELPEGGLLNEKWAGWSAEQIYAELLKEVEKQRQKMNGKGSGQDGQGQDGEGGESDGNGKGSYHQALDKMFGPGPTFGEVMDAAKESEIQDQADWKEAMSSAAQVAKSQGKLPGDIEQAVKELMENRVDWKAVLRRFVQQNARLDYDWRRPARRYMSMGVYLPSMRSESLPPIVIFWDTSGSMNSDEDRKKIGSELTSIIEEAKPETTHLAFFDDKVQRTQEFSTDDLLKFKPRGGGGTSFVPAFRWLKEQEIEPCCVIVFTDCMGTFPDEDDRPECPVLWASTMKLEQLRGSWVPPFGEFLYLDIE